MELYLVQHGTAKSKDEDPERALTDHGAATVTAMASRAASSGTRITEIWHSDKKRAIQTAHAFASALQTTAREREGLSPNDDVVPLARELNDRSEPLLIAGHLPHLARLASVLLTGRTEPSVVTFQNAGLVRLDRDEDGGWSLRWNIPPEALI